MSSVRVRALALRELRSSMSSTQCSVLGLEAEARALSRPRTSSSSASTSMSASSRRAIGSLLRLSALVTGLLASRSVSTGLSSVVQTRADDFAIVDAAS